MNKKSMQIKRTARLNRMNRVAFTSVEQWIQFVDKQIEQGNYNNIIDAMTIFSKTSNHKQMADEITKICKVLQEYGKDGGNQHQYMGDAMMEHSRRWEEIKQIWSKLKKGPFVSKPRPTA